MPLAPSDYDRQVAGVLRDIKEDFNKTVPEGSPVVDSSVREGVNADLDKMIERRESSTTK